MTKWSERKETGERKIKEAYVLSPPPRKKKKRKENLKKKKTQVHAAA